MGQAVVEGLSLGVINMTEPTPIWRAAGDAVLSEVGCHTVDVYTLDNDITWEATYTCESGERIDNATVTQNRARWRDGLTVDNPLEFRNPTAGRD
ncbi:MAG: hypothetical protein R3C25_14560 [Hyphomonadaceae bacterium]